MTLTITTRFWLPKLKQIIHNWFDFGVDLAGLTFDEKELTLDLNTGRE